MTHPPQVAPPLQFAFRLAVRFAEVNLRLNTDFVNRTKHMSSIAVRNIAYEQHDTDWFGSLMTGVRERRQVMAVPGDIGLVPFLRGQVLAARPGLAGAGPRIILVGAADHAVEYPGQVLAFAGRHAIGRRHAN